MGDSFVYRYQLADDAATIVVKYFDSGIKNPGREYGPGHPPTGSRDVETMPEYREVY